MKTRYLLSLVALSVASACQAASYPEPLGPSQSDFGGAGLLQMPSARMAKEGEFSFNYRDNDQYRFYSVSIQSCCRVFLSWRFSTTSRRFSTARPTTSNSFSELHGFSIKS